MKKPYEDEDEYEIKENICPVCGKNFVVPPLNVYKHRKTGKPVCSWPCCNKTGSENGKLTRVSIPKKKVCNRCLYFHNNWCIKKNEPKDAFGKCKLWKSDEKEEKEEIPYDHRN